MRLNKARLMAVMAAIAGTLATIVPFGPADAQWVFVARHVLGRVHHMAQTEQSGRPGYDFATVLLDAPADKVFATVVSVARKNPAVRIVSEDAAARRLQVAEGDRSATLNVAAFNDDVSQLMIAGHASPGEDSTSSRVVQAVLRVCKEMNKHCTVGN